ncbi:hypothetical protein [Methanolobus sp. WCC5]
MAGTKSFSLVAVQVWYGLVDDLAGMIACAGVRWSVCWDLVHALWWIL